MQAFKFIRHSMATCVALLPIILDPSWFDLRMPPVSLMGCVSPLHSHLPRKYN